MNRPPIATLTWGTVAGAVISACLLAAGEAGLPDHPGFAGRGGPAVPHLSRSGEPTAPSPHQRASRPLADAGSNVHQAFEAPR